MEGMMEGAAAAATQEVQGQPSAESELSQQQLEELADEQLKRYKAKVKINGRVEEKTLEEIVNGFRVNKAAEERFQTAAQERKKAEELYKQHEQERDAARQLLQIIESIKTSPKVAMQFLNEAGVDLRGLVTDYITEQTRLSQMSPEEKRIMELQDKLTHFERQEESVKKQKEQEELQRQYENVNLSISNELADSVEKVEGIPFNELTKWDEKDPRRRNVYLAMERAVQLALHQLKNHGQFESFEVLYSKGKNFIQSLTEQGKRSALEELRAGKMPIPKELSQAIRKQDIETLRFPQGNRAASASKPAPQSRASQKKPETISDYFDKPRLR